MEHLAIHKNPLFIFVLIGAKLVHGLAKELLESRHATWVQVCGVVMYWFPVLMIVTAIVFHIYASRKMAGSEQELEFERSSRQVLKQHRAAARRRSP